MASETTISTSPSEPAALALLASGEYALRSARLLPIADTYVRRVLADPTFALTIDEYAASPLLDADLPERAALYWSALSDEWRAELRPSALDTLIALGYQLPPAHGYYGLALLTDLSIGRPQALLATLPADERPNWERQYDRARHEAAVQARLASAITAARRGHDDELVVAIVAYHEGVLAELARQTLEEVDR